jgi:O-antigen ligase
VALRPLTSGAIALVFVAAVFASGAMRPPACDIAAVAAGLLLVLAALGGRVRLAPLALPALIVAVATGVQLALGSTGDGTAALQSLVRALTVAAFALAVTTATEPGLLVAQTAALVAFVAVAFVHRGNERALVALPLPNVNHAAWLLAVLLPTLVALAARGGWWRWPIVGLVLFGEVALFGSGSRAATVVGVLAQAAVLASLARRAPPAALAAGAVALAAAAALGAPRLLQRLGAVVVDAPYRLDLWREVLRLVAAHPLVGIGRGALPAMLAQSTPLSAYRRYDFAENEALQLAVDLGVPAALLALGGAVVAARWVWRSRRRGSTLAVAALASLIALTVGAAVDFAWEVPAVAMAAAITCTLAAPSAGPNIGRAAPLALAVLTVAAGLFGWTRRDLGADDETKRIAALPAPAVAEACTTAGARHPRDGYLALVCAERLYTTGSAAAPAWLDRALLRAPYESRTHLVAAAALLAAGERRQAAGEMRLMLGCARAVVVDDRLRWVADTLSDDSDLLDRAFPDDIYSLRTALEYLGTTRRPSTLPGRHRLAERLLGLDDKPVALVAVALADDAPFAMSLLERASDSGDEAARRAVAAAGLAKGHADLSERAAHLVDAALPRAVRVDDKVALHRARAALLEAAGRTDDAAQERIEAARLDSR